MNLRPEDKSKIIEIAAKIFDKPVEIWAYGSRVSGDSHEGSDLDIIIRSKNKVDFNQFLRFREEIINSNIPILVDANLWEKIPQSFQKNILDTYEIIASL